jgi:hypothetical protein
MPLAIGLAVGVDGARYAIEGVRALTGRIDPFGFARSPLAAARARVAAMTGKDVSQVLGFDPMAALRALLER